MEPAAVVTETAPSKEPQQSWRARPVESGAAAPTTSSKGELQMADQVGHDAVAAGPSCCDREVEGRTPVAVSVFLMSSMLS